MNNRTLTTQSAALVATSAFASFFATLFFFLASELAVANGRAAVAESVRDMQVRALGEAQRAELLDLRARRARGHLPPVLALRGVGPARRVSP